MDKIIADKNGGKLVAMTPSEEAEMQVYQNAYQTYETQNAATLSLMRGPTSRALISAAQSALNVSDMVALRCMKAGVTFPADWQTYVTDLRGIVNSGTGTIPAAPDYPAGT